MYDLVNISLEQMQIINWDFEKIKAELARKLSDYEGIVYTDEKSAKADKKELKKLKDQFEEKRKAFKKLCLEPYEEIEPKVKEIVEMIDGKSAYIDKVVKEYGENEKQKKAEEIKKFYDNKAFILGEHAETLYEKLFDQKWLLKGTKKPQYEEGVQEAIVRAKRDIEDIKAMDSPFVDTLLKTYVETLSMDVVQAKNEELLQAMSDAGLDSQKDSSVAISAVTVPVSTLPEAAGEEGVTVRIFANRKQMNQIFDFMKALGISYEVQ